MFLNPRLFEGIICRLSLTAFFKHAQVREERPQAANLTFLDVPGFCGDPMATAAG